MPEFIVEKYKAEHAIAIMNSGHTRSMDDPTHAQIMEQSKFSVTLMADDKPIICSGIVELWPGVGEGWFVATDDLTNHPVTIARATKEVLYDQIDEGGYWRLQANIRTTWFTAVRFSEFLGFEKEGVMKKFGPDGANYLRVAIVK